MPMIGWLSGGSVKSDNAFRLQAFRDGLKTNGFVEGENVAIGYRWAEGNYDRLPALAADLVQRRAAVIVTPGAPPAFAAKRATSTIPVVFLVGTDPVQSGLVASLNRPGGNLTGLAVLNVDLAAKRLELLLELVPKATVVALLAHPTNPITESEAKNLRDAAHYRGLQPHILRASTASEIDGAFETLARLGAGALVVSTDPYFNDERDQIVALAARYRMPTIYGFSGYVTAGGLMSYGANLTYGYRWVGNYTGKVLHGAAPGELPVEQVIKVELVINLKAAAQLGLTAPPTLLARADEVFE
jgi:putative ABC transport system substrate-binding protein